LLSDTTNLESGTDTLNQIRSKSDEIYRIQTWEQLLEAISYMGFEELPDPGKSYPGYSRNKDLIACAQTGTGKTGAFVLPILE